MFETDVMFETIYLGNRFNMKNRTRYSHFYENLAMDKCT